MKRGRPADPTWAVARLDDRSTAELAAVDAIARACFGDATTSVAEELSRP